MDKLRYKVRGNSSPQGKERIYFCCHPLDFDIYFEPISDEILELQNCAIWYDCNPKSPWSDEQLEETMQYMQLFVIPVTERFLKDRNSFQARDLELKYAQEHHIPILPLLQSSDLMEEFGAYFGSIQYLDKHQLAQDSTAIPYLERLRNFLSDVLLGDTLTTQIRSAFDAYIFMSYRKKDRAYAQELMRLIHQNDFCRDIAIWYDEYLVPGENFNQAILDAMTKSSLFTFVVTPNLLEKDNYVMTTEYPTAQKMGKPIIAVEMKHTDNDRLNYFYKNIPLTVDAHDQTLLSETLWRQIHHLTLEVNNDPMHLFFIGLAYHSGIDVEKDVERGLHYIESAAKAGVVEAIKKLVQIFRTGDGVAQNMNLAIQWQDTLAYQWERKYRFSNNFEDGYSYLLANWDLTRYLEQVGKGAAAKLLLQQMLPEFEHLEALADTVQKQRILGIKIPVFLDLAQTHIEGGDFSLAEQYGSRAIALTQTLQSELSNPDGAFLSYAPYYLLGNLYQASGNFPKAREMFQSLCTTLETELSPSSIAEDQYFDMLAVAYNALGNMELQLGSYDRGLLCLQKSCSLKQEVVNISKSVEDQTFLSFFYMNLGILQMKLERSNDAIANFDSAISILESLRSKNRPNSLPSMVAMIYISIGSLYLDIDLSLGRKYLEIGRKFCEERTKESDLNSDFELLEHCYSSLAYSYDLEQRYQMADDYYQKAIEITKKLILHTGKHEYYHSLGSLYYELGTRDEASFDLSWLQKSLEIRQELAEKYPDSVIYQEEFQYTQEALQIAQTQYARSGKTSYTNTLSNTTKGGTSMITVPNHIDEHLASMSSNIMTTRESALNGNEAAQAQLGLHYQHGDGVAKDIHTAIFWLKLAAKKNSDIAAFVLGNIYYSGDGVEQNYTSAMYYLAPSAQRGFTPAQYAYGLCLLDDEVPDVDSGLMWIEKAAAQGYPYAQLELGDLYANGRLVPLSRDKAIYWYEKASDQGNETARARLQNIRQSVTLSKPAAVDAESEQTQERFYQAGIQYFNQGDYTNAHRSFLGPASMGHAGSQYYEGRLLCEGKGTPQNLERGIKLLQKAAAQGMSAASDYLSKMNTSSAAQKAPTPAPKESAASPQDDEAAARDYLARGFDAYKAKDYETAYRAFDSAARLNDPYATYMVGMMWLKGLWVQKDPAYAGKVFNVAFSGLGDAEIENLIFLHTIGAFELQPGVFDKWITFASNENIAIGHYYLALKYANGNGVPKDLRKAKALLQAGQTAFYQESSIPELIRKELKQWKYQFV